MSRVNIAAQRNITNCPVKNFGCYIMACVNITAYYYIAIFGGQFRVRTCNNRSIDQNISQDPCRISLFCRQYCAAINRCNRNIISHFHVSVNSCPCDRIARCYVVFQYDASLIRRQGNIIICPGRPVKLNIAFAGTGIDILSYSNGCSGRNELNITLACFGCDTPVLCCYSSGKFNISCCRFCPDVFTGVYIAEGYETVLAGFRFHRKSGGHIS